MLEESGNEQVGSLNALASSAPAGPESASPMPQQAPAQGLGGPGVDTPQEKQAVELLMQGAQAFRKATQIDPSVRYIVDDILQKRFLSITKHYGLEQEGKLALQQAKLGADKQKSAVFSGPPAPPSFE